MTDLFLTILNMNITASYIALAVIIIRIPLKKLPKIFSYVLWLPVWVRLIFPFSFQSSLSILSFFKPNVETNTGVIEFIPNQIGVMEKPSIDVGINSINDVVNTSLPPAAPMASVNPIQIIIEAATIIWLVGIAILLAYSFFSYLKVLDNVQTVILVKENIFETDRITTPFVYGFIHPKIYIPAGLNENELSYILAHEQTHIRRLDYLVKPIAFFVLILHWFNPIIWLSFALMSKDMEMSCDESVIKKMGNNVKGSYASSLLSLSAKRSGLLSINPLAFGESHIKSRIKNILTYKNPAFWVVVIAVTVTVALIVSFTANPKNEQVSAPLIYSEYNIDALIANKTQYVGNNSKVIALIVAMPLPSGIIRDKVELHTVSPPYGITIQLKMNEASNATIPYDNIRDTLYRNSILLFSLIDNVDYIRYYISDNKNINNDRAFTYTRERAEKLIGEDIRNYAVSPDALKKLIDRVNSLTFNALDEQIEKNLEIIMSSPLQSSAPYDYIKAHLDEYESIIKMGDQALDYLLAQFASRSNNDDLKGHIMMALAKDLLGDRNNVTDESLSPQEWYSQLSPYQEINLPDFKANVPDKIEQLVYDAAVKQYSWLDRGFTIVAPTIYASYEEGNKLKVFVTVYSQQYKLYDKTLSETSGAIVPAAITFTKNPDGSYRLDEYLEAMDGSLFSKSIKGYCVMPVSKKEIKGLSDTILKDYGNHKNRSELLMKNLVEHLKNNYQKDIVLKRRTGETIPLT